MTTKKRWHNTYEGDNPFQLPQTVAEQVREHARGREQGAEVEIGYLWIRLCEVGEHTEDCRLASHGPVGIEDWLSVIDETASLGARAALITFQAPVRTHPELVDMCRWAQDTHDMITGLHVRVQPLTQDDFDLLGGLDPDKTPIFADSDIIDTMRFIEASPFRLLPSEGNENDTMSGVCLLPKSVMCVSCCGTMFVCGLVICDGEFRLGNVLERKLAKVMGDDSLPHVIPEEVPKEGRQCCGCPPLMLQRLEQVGNSG